MDTFKQITVFVAAATRGSLSAAARVEGVTPAIVGRRLDALEARLGVKLMLRTTRKLTLTFEGEAFLEDCQRILNDLASAEAAVSLGAYAPPATCACRHRPVSVAGMWHHRSVSSCATIRRSPWGWIFPTASST